MPAGRRRSGKPRRSTGRTLRRAPRPRSGRLSGRSNGSNRARQSGSAVARGRIEESRESSRSPPTRTAAPRLRRLPVPPGRSVSSRAVPLRERLEADRPPQPSAVRITPCGFAFQHAFPIGERLTRSTDHVWQQSEVTCALDRLREFALLLRRNRGDTAPHPLAPLGTPATEEARRPV